MLQLIQHIVRTSASRDRTEINGALMDALLDMFRPKIAYVHSCFLNERLPQFYTAAGFDGTERFVRNAYLPERQHCHPIANDPLLARCIAEARPTLDILPDGNHRLLFPVLREERPVHAVDITVAETLGSAQRVALMGLLEYFGNHLSLLDYGETDTLTGLANRKTFDKHLFEVLGNTAVDAYINQALPADFHRRHGSSDQSHHWLGVIDIDHFKRINDTQGHLIGDEVLVMLSQLMRNSFRFDDQLFRFGGEEFIVVLQPTTPIGAHQTFERFRLDVAAPHLQPRRPGHGQHRLQPAHAQRHPVRRHRPGRRGPLFRQAPWPQPGPLLRNPGRRPASWRPKPIRRVKSSCSEDDGAAPGGRQPRPIPLLPRVPHDPTDHPITAPLLPCPTRIGPARRTNSPRTHRSPPGAIPADTAFDLVSPSGHTRTLVIAVARSADWPHVAALYQALQDDPGTARPGPRRHRQAGFPTMVLPGRSGTAGPGRGLPECPAPALPERTRRQPVPAPSRAPTAARWTGSPAFQAATGLWSAYIDPTMGSMFAEDGGLPMAPNPHGQADLLAGLSSIKPDDFQRARERLGTAPGTAADTRQATPPAPQGKLNLAGGTFADPRDFLLAVMNDPGASPELRVEAAKALLPYFARALPA